MRSLFRKAVLFRDLVGERIELGLPPMFPGLKIKGKNKKNIMQYLQGISDPNAAHGSPDAGKGYTVLFGEGVADWKATFAAAEHGGGVEYYLIEQEGSRMSELDTARECLKTYRKMRG